MYVSIYLSIYLFFCLFVYLFMYLLIDLTFICPPLFTFVAPQEDEDQVVQDAADAAGALM